MKFKILNILLVVSALIACNKENADIIDNGSTVYTSKVEVSAQDSCLTKVYDSDLNWNWEDGDSMLGYQISGQNLRNTLAFVSANAGFVCEAFNYMSTNPERFHFVYPAAAEVSEGVLVAVQDGVWRPLSVTTTVESDINSLPVLSFEMLSAALELRIFAEDKSTPVNVVAASIASESDFVGKWTLQDDYSYTQSLDGKSISIEGLDASVVSFNMPNLPDGIADKALTLVLKDAEGGSMTRTLPAMTFVKGKRTILNIVYTADPVGGGEPVEPDPEEPEIITGTFTCATYNVDGLPQKILGFISLNDDGPGSNGTSAISNKIATSGWDVVTFQENFTYNNELVSAMNANYTFGTHREFSLLSALGTADTDGLGFATLKSTCSFSGETWEAFTDAYGGLDDGANTSLKKGIRYYVVTFKNVDKNGNEVSILVDVLVTHMNSGSDSGHIGARQSQLAQIAAYINKIRGNNRPIILMGDTNCRYTRDDFKTYFWEKLDQDLVVADPWVEYSWNGVYPTLGSASLMVPSKDASSTLTEQTGEVVDKIIYINNPNAPVQIKANNYMNDESYAGIADHNPVRAEFTYTYTVEQ